jgi:hypothetical protein
MSRKEWDNEKWHFAAGVDGVTSAFFEVWEQPHAKQDCPAVSVNNTGVVCYVSEDWLPPPLRREIAQLRRYFDLSRQDGNPYPNLDYAQADAVARSIGFHDLKAELFELYD